MTHKCPGCYVVPSALTPLSKYMYMSTSNERCKSCNAHTQDQNLHTGTIKAKGEGNCFEV